VNRGHPVGGLRELHPVLVATSIRSKKQGIASEEEERKIKK